MLVLWLLCMAAYMALPFQLLDRQLTWSGGLMLVLFIVAFVVGSISSSGHSRKPVNSRCVIVDSHLIEYFLMAVSASAIVLFVIDAWGRDLFDIAVAYERRSEAADALLKGNASETSIWFQLAFVLYPAAYVFTVVHLLYSQRIGKTRLFFFGLLPIGLAAALMGGRMPILYALLLAWLASRERHKVGHAQRNRSSGWRRHTSVGIVLIIVGALFYYFVTVFLVRAEMAGGTEQMFDFAEERWNIAFRGTLTDVLFSILGVDITYLFFVFVWYLVQGFVMANFLFSAYDGPMQLGGYGIDLMSAVMRRLDPVGLANGFDVLLNLGTYGFFPSAWGSLFVDFGYAGLLVSLGWGAGAGLVYKRIVRERRKDWLLVGPFVSAGIAVSTINTPLGFANGFVTHCWLLLAIFLLSRRVGPQRFDGQCAAEPHS